MSRVFTNYPDGGYPKDPDVGDVWNVALTGGGTMRQVWTGKAWFVWCLEGTGRADFRDWPAEVAGEVEE